MAISQIAAQPQLALAKRGVYVKVATCLDLSWAGMSIMPNPFAPPIVLDLEAQNRLQALRRAHSTPQALVFRCRLILRLADKDRPSNLQVANEFGCARNTVALWHTRFLQNGLAGLQDAPRPGRPRSFSPR
jgi:hypothetical protein